MSGVSENPNGQNNNVIRISAITVRPLNAHRILESIKIIVNNSARNQSWDREGKDIFHARLDPQLDFASSDELKLDLHSSWLFGSKDRSVTISGSHILEGLTENVQKWKRPYRESKVVVELSLGPFGSNPSSSWNTLVPTTDDLARDCPRSRILLIGKTGIGKSSLINAAFGTKEAHVSDLDPGKAEIDKEILSKNNDKYVLHDSQGFEHAEGKNFNAVCEFIRRRNDEPALKDKLHAIWMCFETPTAGGRVFEAGDEKFLQLKKAGELGNAPVIAVFTKYDELVGREAYEHGREGAKIRAGEAFKQDCRNPFLELVGEEIPLVYVSVTKGYEETISQLIQVTVKMVGRDVAENASDVTAIAQRGNPMVKVDTSIAVGKKRYWSSLASSANFSERTIATCLDVIHTDIVNVWNFYDPAKHLNSPEFKALMSNLVSADAGTASNPNKSLATSLAMAGAIAGIVGALAGPAAPIALPIVGGLVLAKWAYDVYKASHSTLHHLMTYIVDLTLIMQNVFWLAEGSGEVSRKLIKVAFKAYMDSGVKGNVHFQVSEHVKKVNMANPGTRDMSLEKITEILTEHRIETKEMFERKGQFKGFNISALDEEWDPH